MENNKVEVIVNEHIALDYSDLQKLFKDAFGSENVEKLTFINQDKEDLHQYYSRSSKFLLQHCASHQTSLNMQLLLSSADQSTLHTSYCCSKVRSC